MKGTAYSDRSSGLAQSTFSSDNMGMNTIEDILAAARALPSGERARLIPLLWDQFAPEDWAAPSLAWIAETKRRSDLIDAGEMQSDDWANVRARARRLAGLSE